MNNLKVQINKDDIPANVAVDDFPNDLRFNSLHRQNEPSVPESTYPR